MEKVKGFSIVIDGETVGFDRSIQGINRALSTTTNQIKNLNKQLKLDPKNVELLTKKFDALTQKQELTKAKLEEYKKKLADMDETDVGSKEWVKIQNQINNTETELKQLDAEIEKTSKSIKEFEKPAKKTFQEIGKSVEDAGKKMSDVGGELSKKVTLPIVAAATASALAWNNLDDALDTIITKTGATGDVAEKLEVSFKNVFSSLPTDAESTGEAIGELNTQFGFMGKELEDNSRLLIKYANINKTDVAKGAIGAKKAIEAFNLSEKDLGHVLDATTLASQNSGVAVESLIDKTVAAAPQLKALNLEFEEGVILISKFEQGGIDSSTALGSLAKASVFYAKKNKTLSEGLKETQKSIKNAKSETEALSIASEVFGTKQAVKMTDAIKRGTLSLDELAKYAGKSGGVINRTFEDTLDPADKFKVALNQLQIAGYEIGSIMFEIVAPAVEKVTKVIKFLTDKFRGLSPHMKKAIVLIAGIAAAIGPVLVIGGKLTSLVGKTMQSISGLTGAVTFLTSPIFLVIAAITALIAIGVALYKNNDEFKKLVDDFIARALPLLRQGFEAVGNFIKNDFIPAMQNLWVMFKDNVLPVLEKLWKFISENILPIWVDFFVWFDEKILPILANLYKFISEKLIPTIVAFAEKVGNFLTPIIKVLYQIFTQYILPVLAKLLNFIRTYIVPIFNTLANIISSVVVPVIKGLWVVFDSILTVVGGILSFFGKLIDKFGDLVEGFKKTTVFKTLKTVFEGLATVLEKVFGWLDKILGTVGDVIDGVGGVANAVGEKAGDFIGWINPFDAGGYGFDAGGYGNRSLSVTNNFTVHSENGISDQQLRIYGRKITDMVDEELFRRSR